MKKVLILILALMVILSGCSSAATTATTTTTTTQYLPSPETKALEFGIEALKRADGFIQVSTDLNIIIRDNINTEKSKQMMVTGTNLLGLYVDHFKISSEALIYQTTIEKITNSDPRVEPYTNLVQTEIALLAVQGEIELLQIKIGIVSEQKMITERNKLAKTIGKDIIVATQVR